MYKNNIRHITLFSKVDINVVGSATLYPDMSFNVGCIYLPPNKKYYITNIGITQTDPFFSTGSLGYAGIYHRFYSTDDPISPYLNYGLSRGDAVYYNGTRINTISDYSGNFETLDIRDSQTNIYNRVRYFYQTQALSELNKISTNTKHESVLFSGTPIQRVLPDFYFTSGSNSFLAFSIFPYYASSVVTSMTFGYNINFDLIQE